LIRFDDLLHKSEEVLNTKRYLLSKVINERVEVEMSVGDGCTSPAFGGKYSSRVGALSE
jgi:hypothetical protein